MGCYNNKSTDIFPTFLTASFLIILSFTGSVSSDSSQKGIFKILRRNNTNDESDYAQLNTKEISSSEYTELNIIISDNSKSSNQDAEIMLDNHEYAIISNNRPSPSERPPLPLPRPGYKVTSEIYI